MRTLLKPWNRRHEGRRARIDEDAPGSHDSFSRLRHNAHRMRVEEGSLAVDDLRPRRRDLLVVLLAEHRRQTPLFSDCRPIAHCPRRKIAARRSRKPRTVFKRLRRDAGDIDASAAVALLRTLDKRDGLTALCQKPRQSLARLAEAKDQILIFFRFLHDNPPYSYIENMH